MFKSESTDQLKKLKEQYDNAYYNVQGPMVSDQVYDQLVEEIKLREPNIMMGVGCKIPDFDVKVKLPYFMGSMDKIKLEEPEKLKDWLFKNPATEYIVSNKLNGVSCLIVYSDQYGIKLYTRGDGIEGRDISYFADKIRHIKKLPKRTEIVVRGEIIISQSIFNAKYKEKFSNILGLIVGTVNSKSLREPIFDFEFVAYELIDKSNSSTPLDNLNLLKKLGFKVVNFQTEKTLSIENLTDKLQEQRKTYEYDIDGLIVQSNKAYKRDNTTPDGNPKYAFAFKMYGEIAETEVQEVEWNVSKWGCLKPRITVTPVFLGGSTVTHATGINAKFISENLIGRGARVLITKSGDVIPKVISVVKPAAKADLPQCRYTWNETRIDIYKQDSEKSDCIPLLVHFFVSMDIKEINEGVVTKLVNAGFNSVKKIVNLSIDDLLKVQTIKQKMADRIYNNIHSVLGSDSGVSLGKLLVASGVFQKGFGTRRADDLVNCLNQKLFSSGLLLNTEISADDIVQIKGFSKLTAERFVAKIGDFNSFFEGIRDRIKFIKEYNQK
jgi:DNA ligase (NAD+)